jgi:hypothetical protein
MFISRHFPPERDTDTNRYRGSRRNILDHMSLAPFGFDTLVTPARNIAALMPETAR